MRPDALASISNVVAIRLGRAVLIRPKPTVLEIVVSSSDVEYYRQRADAERQMAQDSDRANVAAIHEELARQYDALVNRAELRPTLRIAFPPEGLKLG